MADAPPPPPPTTPATVTSAIDAASRFRERIDQLAEEIPLSMSSVEATVSTMIEDILTFHKSSKAQATSKGRRKSQRRSRVFRTQHIRREQVCSESLDVKDEAIRDEGNLGAGAQTTNAGEEAHDLIHSRLSDHISFKDLEAKGIDEICHQMRCIVFDEGTTILEEGADNDYFYVVESGMVQVVSDDHIILRSGDVFGDVALLYACPSPHAYVAIEECRLWSLHRKQFRKLMIESASDHHRKLARFIKSVPLLKPLGQDAILRVARALQHKTFAPDEVIMRQGDPPDNFYMINAGTVRITKDDGEGNEIFLCNLTPGNFFGELAFLNDQPRAATVTSNEEVECYMLSKTEFQGIIGSLKEVLEERSLMGLIQRSLEELKYATEEQLQEMVAASSTKMFSEGESIIEEGDASDTFYIIRTGQVKIVQWSKTMQAQVELGSLPSGRYFGERGILDAGGKRAASVICASETAEILMMGKEDFERLLATWFAGKEFADVRELKHKGAVNELEGGLETREAELPINKLPPVASLGFGEIDVGETLGMGVFGSFKLARIHADKTQSVVLKCFQKARLLDSRRKQSALREKHALQLIDSPFVINLYGTLLDHDQIYLLLEYAGGGDAWAALYDSWTEGIEKNEFGGLCTNLVVQWSAMVIVALEHIHSKGVLYRDLRPENVLISGNGTIKLQDFTLSKLLPYNLEDEVTDETFTLCGTPEYMAPEIILNQGHGKTVDFWSLGVFLYELFCAVTPFAVEESTMSTYDHVVKCQSYLAFPPGFDVNARGLIRKLLNPTPGLRFGALKSGFQDIKATIFFDVNNVDWKAVESNQFPKAYVPGEGTKEYPFLDPRPEEIMPYKSLSLNHNKEWFGSF